ncbi:MAG TPA: translation elongation factor 4 [Acidobacteriota bacterium]|nr:translation elongation factor 4 [Acidobacteriota bacterium]
MAPTTEKRTRPPRVDQAHTRNFCIIAHIDHGKSTLADRLLEDTQTIDQRQMRAQVLDKMDLERERGITIKMAAVRLHYKAKDGTVYELNLIDTPGHVDFTYEVSRSLNACEGAVLVVDAAQGVEAQTLANVNLALNNDLEIIPVINKIDLPAADPERVAEEIEETLFIERGQCIPASAKTGQGVEDILEAVVSRIPPPAGDPEAPLRALVFDSHFDPYLGIIAYVRVVDGEIRPGMKIRMMATGHEAEIAGVGIFGPEMLETEALLTGQVGFVHAAIKSIGDCRVGDTMTERGRRAEKPLPGYHEAKPMVFCGLYPVDSEQFPDLREALAKLQLNDASLSYEPETSAALGFGFRCGFLGLLHSEIVQERLEREFDIPLVATAPSVVYRVILTDGTVEKIDNPTHWPDGQKLDRVEEPYVLATIMTPSQYVGSIMELCNDRRGTFGKLEYNGPERAMLTFQLPLSEILMDFFDALKSRTKGYASFDYEMAGYKEDNLVKMDILLNGEPVDALSFITHRDKAYYRGKALVKKLKEVLPRQLFEIRLQAALGRKVIAAEKIPALRKNVTAKCYGGDVTRKRKLLERQKEGKKRMKSVGQVEIPQEAFLSVLKVDE